MEIDRQFNVFLWEDLKGLFFGQCLAVGQTLKSMS
jgi:hypothetical protein